MTQLNLFNTDGARIAAQDRKRQNHVPYQPSSDTSRLGAMSVAQIAGTQVGRYLAKLFAAGAAGLTDHEASGKTGLALATICARRNSVKDVWVFDTGLRRVSEAGVKNVAWVHKAYAGGAR